MNETSMNAEVMDFFKALVNADRLKIAGLVGVQVLTAAELAESLNIKLNDVINSLGYLQHAGIVKPEGKGYRLDTDALEKLSRRVLAGQRQKFNPAELDGDEFDRRVLSDFLTPEGKIKSFPSQQKKLLSILRHTTTVFQPGVRYPEKQVNDLLRRFNDDTASLRRYLVDFGFITRQNGIYWITES